MSQRPLVLSLLLVAACGPTPNPRLAPLAQATLEAGVGLGDVKLGETTLGPFFDRFGQGFVTLIASDTAGLELVYEEGEIAFLFQFDSMRWTEEEQTAMRRASSDLGGYLEAYPHRRELPLTSITVRIDDDTDSTFFKGRLKEGVALFDPFVVSTGRVGAYEPGALPLMAGLNPNNPRETASYPKRGLILYGERDPHPGKTSRVTRMTVFLPERSRRMASAGEEPEIDEEEEGGETGD